MGTGAPVTIYTTRMCGYCTAAKRLLAARGIAYEEVDVTFDGAKRAWLLQATGQRTVPQIFIRGAPIGGYGQLAALDRSGQLGALVREGESAAAPPPGNDGGSAPAPRRGDDEGSAPAPPKPPG